LLFDSTGQIIEIEEEVAKDTVPDRGVCFAAVASPPKLIFAAAHAEDTNRRP
jgi:hypothetical protein